MRSLCGASDDPRHRFATQRGLLLPPVVADDLIREQNILFLRTATDVVNHERPASTSGIQAHHADVIQTAGQAPCDNITGLERAADNLSASLEELHEIGHPAMV